MKFLFTISVSISVILNLCGQNTSKFIKDISHYKSGEPTLYYSLIRDSEKKLKLDTIENGFDSLEIRIWYNYPKSYIGNRILILKKQNNLWSANLFNRSKDSIVTMKPKSDWNTFLSKLYSYDILTLPDMYEIKGLEDNWVDGDSYCIEIADKYHYRLYHYHVPEEFKHKFQDVKKMVKILKLLKKEFGIPLTRE
jgi:hypothetical protein